MQFLVVSKIEEQASVNQINLETMNIPQVIKLADRQFHTLNKAGIITGVEAFWDFICADQFIPEQKEPILQRTMLGWRATRQMDSDRSSAATICHLSIMDNIYIQLQTFWQPEDSFLSLR
jgi:hypothetical protein